MKKIGILIPMALLLIGAGCSTNTTTQNTNKEIQETQNTAQASVEILPAKK